MPFYCQNTIRPKKDTKLCLRVEKWSRSVSHLFFYLYTKLAESSFLRRFRVRIRQCFCLCHVPFLQHNFAHAQALYRMSSLCRSYECINIAQVNIRDLTGWTKIKQRRISFPLCYLRMIL